MAFSGRIPEIADSIHSPWWEAIAPDGKPWAERAESKSWDTRWGWRVEVIYTDLLIYQNSVVLLYSVRTSSSGIFWHNLWNMFLSSGSCAKGEHFRACRGPGLLTPDHPQSPNVFTCLLHSLEYLGIVYSRMEELSLLTELFGWL